MNKHYYVYILASKSNGTLYIGITSNLVKRIYEHKHDAVKGFTQTYAVHMLVYYEEFNNIQNALYREKQLKWWKREWKISLIEESNPQWNDLYDHIS